MKMLDHISGNQSSPPQEFVPPPNRARMRSEAAAVAAQRWEELEAHAEATRLQLQTAQGHIQVLEESNKILHDEIALLKDENSRLLRDNIIIHTRISAACELLISLRSPISEAKAETEAAIAAAIAQPMAPSEQPKAEQPKAEEKPK